MKVKTFKEMTRLEVHNDYGTYAFIGSHTKSGDSYYIEGHKSTQYSQEQFGEASVTLEDGTLHFRLKKVDSALRHKSGDTFTFHVDGAGHFDLTFDVRDGRSESLTFDIGDPICPLMRE